MTFQKFSPSVCTLLQVELQVAGNHSDHALAKRKNEIWNINTSTNQHSEGNVRVTGTEGAGYSGTHLEMTNFVWCSRLTHCLVQVKAFKCPVDYRLQSI